MASTSANQTEPSLIETPVETLSEISVKLNDDVYKIAQKRGRSQVWQDFGKIIDGQNIEILNVVGCRECKNAFKLYNKSTTNLIAHECYKKFELPLINVTELDKKRIRSACAEWSVKDGISFLAVSGSGLEYFVQEVIHSIYL